MKNDPRVLIVEEDAAIAELLAVNLRHNGYAPSVAFDAATALREVDMALPNVIIVDWQLRESSGLDLAIHWRRHERTRHLPILMLSALGSDEAKVAALDAGVDDYITKPFSTLELMARIRAILRRKSRDLGADVLECGSLRLEAASHRISLGEAELHVGPTEFRLLYSLMKRPGKVCSRALLREEVWGNYEFVAERTVDVHIKRLREGLQTAGSMIETVRGTGYRFSSLRN